MRLVRTFLIWLRTRKRAATALTFDALLKRAERQATTSHDAGRPNYLPDPGAVGRIGLALAGGLSLYAAIATIVLGSVWGGRWWLLSIAALPLVLIALHIGRALMRNLKQSGVTCDGTMDCCAEIATVRTLFWPITEPLGVLIGWIACYTYYGIDRIVRWWRGHQPTDSIKRSADTHSDAVRRIPDLILEIINEERERLFGEKSPFAALRKRIEAELQEARNLHAYFTRRAREAGEAERRTTAIERATSARDQLTAERTRLDEWRARVDAELSAYREHVQGLGPEIDELVQYRALSRLERSAEHLAAEVEAMIAEMTTGLLTRVQGRCRELSGALHDASVQVAVAAADTKDADRDVRIITDTVCELVRRAPTYDADTVRAELRRPTRTAVHS